MNRLLQDKKSGWKLVKAESLKLRHTFGKKLPAAAPLFTILLAFFLTGGGRGKALPIGAWNWWYTLLLPGMLAVLCYLGVRKDKKTGDYHIWMQPEPIRKCLAGKIMYYVLALVTANFLLFGGVLLCGKLFGSTIGGLEGFCGFLLLSIASLWEIPLYMLLSSRFGMFATVFSCVVLSFCGVGGIADTNLWWLCPSAVPSRLMCPVLGILPNGLPVPAGSSLWNRNVILPGILISLSWFILLTGFVRCQFESPSDRQRGRRTESRSGSPCLRSGAKRAEDRNGMRTSMGTLFRYIKADFHKTKRLPIRLAHLLIPVGMCVLFLIYYTYSAWDCETKIVAYFQVLGMGLPLLTGLFCAMLSEQELAAGGFQNMLSVQKRAAAFFSKLLMLLLFGTSALLLASVLFGTGYFFGMGQRSVGYLFYWKAAFVLMGSSIFLYVLHLFLAFRFDKGVTIALGFVESLLSALLLTGMGEGIWMYVPAAWTSRFVTLFYHHEKFCMMNGRYDTMDISIFSDLRTAVWICTVLTLVGLPVFGIWACRFESPGGKE